MSVQRYRFVGVPSHEFQQALPAGIIATTVSSGPDVIQDISLSDDAYLPDLTELMEFYGWQFVETSPANLVPHGLRSSKFVELGLTADAFDSTYVPLLSDTITVSAGCRVLAMFTATVVQKVSLGGRVEFRLSVDGIPMVTAGTNVSELDQPQSISLVQPTGVLAAGDRDLLVEWRIQGAVGATAEIDPSDVGHASLALLEMA